MAPDYENKSLTLYDGTGLEAELRAAGVWDSGFETFLVYNVGDNWSMYVFGMIRDTIQGLNILRPGLPPFIVNVVGLDWIIYLEGKEMFYFPVFMGKWSADYCDPDNFARPYMYSHGAKPFAHQDAGRLGMIADACAKAFLTCVLLKKYGLGTPPTSSCKGSLLRHGRHKP